MSNSQNDRAGQATTATFARAHGLTVEQYLRKLAQIDMRWDNDKRRPVWND